MDHDNDTQDKPEGTEQSPEGTNPERQGPDSGSGGVVEPNDDLD